MEGIVLRSPGGLDRLELIEMPDPGQPAPGEIRVRLHASSLNFHDYLVVTGKIQTADRLIPMSDGAGVVEALGEGGWLHLRVMIVQARSSLNTISIASSPNGHSVPDVISPTRLD